MKKMFKFVLLLASLFVLLSNTVWQAFADSALVTEEQYWALMQETRLIVSKLKDAPTEEKLKVLDQLATRWETIKEVEIDGQKIPVNSQYLIDMLRESPPNLVNIEETLSSFLNARQNLPTEKFSSAELDLLNNILTRPEFQWVEVSENPVQNWFQKIITEINRLLNRLLGVTFEAINSNAVVVVMAILMTLILFFVFRTIFSDFASESILGEENNETEPLTSEAALAKAQQLSRGGDYRVAVRYLYLSTLLILDERGIMRYDRSKTNREYLRSVANAPELSQPLQDVIDVFDNVWYGHHTLEEETFKHYSNRVEELKEKRS